MATSQTDAQGGVGAAWILGTHAGTVQTLDITATTGRSTTSLELRAVAKARDVVALRAGADSVVSRLGDWFRIPVVATDSFGNSFVPDSVRLVTQDTGRVTVAADSVSLLRRGWTHVTVRSGRVADTVAVEGIQVVQSILIPTDTFRLHSIGQAVPLDPVLQDDRERVVLDSLPAVSVRDTTVVRVAGQAPMIQAVANGVTAIVLSVGTIVKQASVEVAQQPVKVSVNPDTVPDDAVGDSIRLVARATDSAGSLYVRTPLSWTSRVPSVATVDANGLVRTAGNGTDWVVASGPNGVADSALVTVAQRVVGITIASDSVLFTALTAQSPVGATARDRLSSPVNGAALQYQSADTTVVTVSGAGGLVARGNGRAVVSALFGAIQAALPVRVQQKPMRLLLPVDSIGFVAIGETQSVLGIAVDSLGFPVTSHVQALRVLDTTVARLVDSVTVRSHGNGNTQAMFTVGGLAGSVTLRVQQVPESVSVKVQSQNPIVTLQAGAQFPVVCATYDRNAVLISGALVTLGSRGGTVASGPCGSTPAVHSGVDTLDVTAGGGVRSSVPVVLAIAPTASSPLGTYVQFDSLPSGGGFPWAPSLSRDANGNLQLYITVYTPPDSTGYLRGNLYRYQSASGGSFVYQAMAIPHADSICDPEGRGIEETTVVPRADSAGFRMFYHAGSDACYGWQTFSAVSADGRSWLPEPGVRLDNGNTGPASKGPWPQGEGMVVDQLPDGEWRMLVAGYERVSPPQNVFQIVEWRSSDQVNWRYVGPVLTTGQMPFPMQGSVYSPAIRKIGAGLWRMLFTADNRGSGQPLLSEVWSAVSTDKETWQVEGPVLGAQGSVLDYVAMDGDMVVYVRKDSGLPLSIAFATVLMP